MFKIICIDHIVLRTTNQKKLVQFYCAILGCQIEKNQSEIKLVQLRAGDNLIDILEVTSDINFTQRNLEHFCLRITPFHYETLKKYFEDNNISVRHFGHRNSAKGMGWSFYITDPDGNEVELTGV